jgi:hypothetical protein
MLGGCETTLCTPCAARRAPVGPTALPPPEAPGTPGLVLCGGGVRGGGRGPAWRWAPRAPARPRRWGGGPEGEPA